MTVRLVCGNCGKIETFESWQHAFEMGWDTVERFGYNGCNECPGVSVYFPMLYAQAGRMAVNEELKQIAFDMAALYTHMWDRKTYRDKVDGDLQAQIDKLNERFKVLAAEEGLQI